MKNTLTSLLASGKVDANCVAEFLEELYDNFQNNEHIITLGVGSFESESVKNSLIEKHESKNMCVDFISFSRMKSIKSTDKTEWIVNAMNCPVSIQYSYVNKTEELRSIVKSIVDVATHDELLAMQSAYEVHDCEPPFAHLLEN